MMMLSKLFTTFERDMGTLCDVSTCTCQAVWIVSVHQIDHCDQFPSKCQHIFACARHANMTREITLDRLKAMRAILADGEIFVRCNSCQTMFGTLDDACKQQALVLM